MPSSHVGAQPVKVELLMKLFLRSQPGFCGLWSWVYRTICCTTCPAPRVLWASWACAAKHAAWQFLLLVQGISSTSKGLLLLGVGLENTDQKRGTGKQDILAHQSSPLCINWRCGHGKHSSHWFDELWSLGGISQLKSSGVSAHQIQGMLAIL